MKFPKNENAIKKVYGFILGLITRQRITISGKEEETSPSREEEEEEEVSQKRTIAEREKKDF